jgi:hypothetical protein
MSSEKCNKLPETHDEFRLRNLTIELALNILKVSVHLYNGNDEMVNYYNKTYMSKNSSRQNDTAKQIFNKDVDIGKLFYDIRKGETRGINEKIKSPNNFFKFALSVWHNREQPNLEIFGGPWCKTDDAVGKMRYSGAKLNGCNNYDLISAFNKIVIDPDKKLLASGSRNSPEKGGDQEKTDDTLKCILNDFKERIYDGVGTPKSIIENFPRGRKGGDKRKSRKRTRRRRRRKKYSKKSNRKLKKKSRKRKRKKRTRRRR